MHHTAIQVQDHPDLGTGWLYAAVHPRRGGYPLGYCGQERHTHPTEAEARQCFRRWQRDGVRLDATLGEWASCRATVGTGPDATQCGDPTKTAATQPGGYGIAPLCGAHLTAEHAHHALGLEEPEAGDSWQS